jgi:hypothetical protein
MLKDESRVEGGEVLTILLNESLKERSGSNNGTGNSQRTNEKGSKFYWVLIAVPSYAIILR